jgi:hypothetical protein
MDWGMSRIAAILDFPVIAWWNCAHRNQTRMRRDVEFFAVGVGKRKGAAMSTVELKNFGTPDEVREFPKGRLELIKVGGATVGRAIFQPGWRWATSLQPIVKTKSCEAPHFQYHVSGVLRVRMDDGKEFDCKSGDVSLLPSGHDAWVVGNEPAVVVDFQGMIDYAKSL